MLEVETSVVAPMLNNSNNTWTLKLDFDEIIFPMNDVKGPYSILTVSPFLKLNSWEKTSSALQYLFNFPAGKIFLGDAGAYIIGHLLIWSAIILVNHSSKVSPFAMLLIFFWPIADTLLAIWRRWKQKKRAAQPNRLHFHQLVMRFFEIRFFGRNLRHIVDPLSKLILVPLISVPQGSVSYFGIILI